MGVEGLWTGRCGGGGRSFGFTCKAAHYFLVVLQKSWLQCKELNGKKRFWIFLIRSRWLLKYLKYVVICCNLLGQ